MRRGPRRAGVEWLWGWLVGGRRGWSDIERRRALRRSVQASRPPATAPDTTRTTLPACLFSRSCPLLVLSVSSRPFFFARLSAVRDRLVVIAVVVDLPARQPPENNPSNNMLIGLMRDSVLQCFCHSCKAPLGIVGESSVWQSPRPCVHPVLPLLLDLLLPVLRLWIHRGSAVTC